METNLLNEFLGNLEKFANAAIQTTAPTELPDSFKEELSRPPRTTATISIVNAPEIKDFEREWVDALIKNDAVRQGLAFANTILTTVMTGGLLK